MFKIFLQCNILYLLSFYIGLFLPSFRPIPRENFEKKANVHTHLKNVHKL